MASMLTQRRPPNAFDVGVRRMSYCLIGFMVVVAPLVMVLNGLSTGRTGGEAVDGLAVGGLVGGCGCMRVRVWV